MGISTAVKPQQPALEFFPAAERDVLTEYALDLSAIRRTLFRLT